MTPLLFALKPHGDVPARLCAAAGLEAGVIERRNFPDGESYLRFATPVAGRDVVLHCTLDRPDEIALPMLFAADAARTQGALSVGLVAPYLAYMRQDRSFHPGEAVTSISFARLLSAAFDWLVTVDPHLHRYKNLSAIYTIPSTVVASSAAIAGWIRHEVADPVLLGPDAESAQWVTSVAELAGGVPWMVFDKTRGGDRDVAVFAPGLAAFPHSTPVIVDDIVSSAGTMIAVVQALRAAGFAPPVCLGVHALFAADSYSSLRDSGPARIVTTNSVMHETNGIDLTAQVAAAVGAALTQREWAHRAQARS